MEGLGRKDDKLVHTTIRNCKVAVEPGQLIQLTQECRVNVERENLIQIMEECRGDMNREQLIQLMMECKVELERLPAALSPFSERK